MTTSGRFSKTTFFTLLLFGFAVVFAQTLNFKHDLEHEYHGAQESCSIYLAFNGSFDSDLYTFITLDAPQGSVLVSREYSPLFSSLRASFAIRAPPAFLQS